MLPWWIYVVNYITLKWSGFSVELQDESGDRVYRDGKPLIHTDGTGYISEDLALLCPKNLFKGDCLRNKNIEVVLFCCCCCCCFSPFFWALLFILTCSTKFCMQIDVLVLWMISYVFNVLLQLKFSPLIIVNIPCCSHGENMGS